VGVYLWPDSTIRKNRRLRIIILKYRILGRQWRWCEIIYADLKRYWKCERKIEGHLKESYLLYFCWTTQT